MYLWTKRDRSHTPASSSREAHAYISEMQRECFSRVCKWHWTLAGRVDSHEGENGGGNATKLGLRGFAIWVGRQIEAEGSPEEADAHQREGSQQEIASTKGVDGVDSRDCEEPVDDASAEGNEQCLWALEACVLEDLGGVVCNHLFIVLAAP